MTLEQNPPFAKWMLETGAKGIINKSELDRFFSRIRFDCDGCYTWTGEPDNGYGRFWLRGKSTLAHRVAWLTWCGSIPEGLQIDHLCRNRACVNVVHLQPVSIAENVLRGDGRSARNARKTHCLRGHPLSGKNLYRTPAGTRACAACSVERTRQWRSVAA